MANGQGTKDNCVADHAFGLVIAAMRNFRQLDRLCREGVWRLAIPQPPNVSGKRIGILGLGTIGQKIARRAAAFDIPIGYHNRSLKAGAAHCYFVSLDGLAQWCDVLVCAAPGGETTRHLVNAQVLDALGPQGFLLNIGRGSVADTGALATALRDGRIAGTGLASRPAPRRSPGWTTLSSRPTWPAGPPKRRKRPSTVSWKTSKAIFQAVEWSAPSELGNVYLEAAFKTGTAIAGFPRFAVHPRAIERLKLTRFRRRLTVMQNGMAWPCRAHRLRAGTRLAGQPVLIGVSSAKTNARLSYETTSRTAFEG